MSTEQSSGESSQKTATQSQNTTEASTQTPGSSRAARQQSAIEEGSRDETAETEEKKPAALEKPGSKSETTATSPETPDDPRTRPRQVIAVSASKGPAAFFNLARKFLVTDDMCDLSALEGAIVSAADAAHLLERSKLATIVRVETSYVTVEPKRRRQAAPQPGTPGAVAAATTAPAAPQPQQQLPPQPQSPVAAAAARGSAGRELRRARIVITVKRTEMYKQWLADNPLQAVIAGDVDEVEEGDDAEAIDINAPLQDR